MCVAGDFNPEELLQQIKKRITKKDDNKGKIKRIIEKEPKQIVKKQIEQTMEVSMPLFVIGIKDVEFNKIQEEAELIKKHIAIEILLNMLIGKSSKAYKILYEQGLIMSEPYLEYEFEKTYAHIAITGKSNDPKKVLELFQKEIKILKTEGFEEEHFNRIKNMVYGTYIKQYNSVSEIARMFISDYFKGINSFNYLDFFNEVSKEYTQNVLENVFMEEYTVISIIQTCRGRRLDGPFFEDNTIGV